MNSMNFINAFFSSGFPQQFMNMFRKRRRNKGMLLFSLIGLAVSTVALGLKRTNEKSNPLQNKKPAIDSIQNMLGGATRSAFAEFAQEFPMKKSFGKDSGTASEKSNDEVHHFTNEISPANQDLLNQFAMVDQQNVGNSNAFENLSEEFIENNKSNQQKS